MDLNDIYLRHFLSNRRADNLPFGAARRVHRDLADGYARMIAAAKLSGTRACQCGASA